MKNISADILRIIDANINRTGEGLRVLEEFARLTLNDVKLSQKLKNLRHSLTQPDPDLQKQLLSARNAEEDVGSAMDVPGETEGKTPAGLIIANSRRVQESLRVLEEIVKTRSKLFNSAVFREARFAVYTIEKEILGRVTRQDKISGIAGLYVIIDTEWLKGREPRLLTLEAISGGARVIQLRCKNLPGRDFLDIAMILKKVCAEKNVPFIVNDNLGVALACGADGLHIGQEDLPASKVRKLIPIDMLLGVSARTIEEARKAAADGADYLGVGAVFSTSTKDSTMIGLDKLASITKSTELPVIAIGGINIKNIKSVLKAGAAGVAVISAVLGADDVRQAAGQLAKIIGGKKHE
jgi:thiamine-phosphate pyrophosphorylase